MELSADYTKSTLEDVPSLVETIRALRVISKQSHIVTTNTQSAILRQLAPEVLIEVARELEKPYGMEAKLSGTVSGK